MSPTLRPVQFLRRSVEAVLRDRRGGIAVGFALSLPVLMAALGLASDYVMLTKVRTGLQVAADSAAVAGAREIPLAQADKNQIESAAKSYAAFALIGDSTGDDAALAAKQLTVSAAVIDDFSAVKVDITEAWTPFFAHFVSKDVTPVRVTATARFAGSHNLCVLGLETTGSNVFLNDKSRLTGKGCGVFSNSASGNGIRLDKGSSMTSSLACVAGGYSINGSSTANPLPVTDCPAIMDPLADRLPPSFSGCDYVDLEIPGITATLNPGVYCGGIKTSGSANVTLNPGIYVIKGGNLSVTGQTSLTGKDVGFYLTGKGAQAFLFSANTHINLSAPVTGPMAGLLFFEDRNLPGGLNHRITSNDARRLIGTIYLPVGNLKVDSTAAVADQSAYTAIIAKNVQLNSGPHLVLNADYAATNVPVPAGIMGTGQVVLTD